MAIDTRSGAHTGDPAGRPSPLAQQDGERVTPNNPPAQPDGGRAGLTQKRRWLVFGSNVVVAILLATVLVAGTVWLSEVLLRGRWRSDWTSSGRFSLSPRTRAMLGDLEQDVTITNLYAYSPEIPESVEQQRRVRDLLSEYAAVNPSRITVETVNPAVDAGGTEQLVERLRKRYAKELEKPKALIDEFDKLSKDVQDFLRSDAKRLEAAAAAWKAGPPEGPSALRQVAQALLQLDMVGQFTTAGIEDLVNQPLPAYPTAVRNARDYLKKVGDALGAVAEFYDRVPALKDAAAPDEVKAILASAKQTYEPLRKRLEDFGQKAADIKELELDNVRREISQGQAILIEATPGGVKVVAYDDVWVRNPQADIAGRAEEPERLFAGESAVSSTLLSLVSPERPAILFVTAGAPATLPSMGGPFGGGGGGAYARMAERLRKSNFIVEDWDVTRSPEMPKPEHMTKAILVFVPPAPPNPQMPVPPPTPEMYKAAIDVVKGGAPAVLLAEPATMFGPGTPYSDLFADFGVTARLNAVGVHTQVVDAQGTERAVPQIEITQYADHPITRTLGGLPTMFLTPCPLMISKQLPEGVTAEALVLLPAGADYWADTASPSEAMRGNATRSEADDLIPTRDNPIPLAVACTRQLPGTGNPPKRPGGQAGEPGTGMQKLPGTGNREQGTGKDGSGSPFPVPRSPLLGEQKVVLFGDSQWAEDRVAFYQVMGRDLFPGNAELLVNTILWVAGTEHLITVSPEALQARRIGDPGAWTLPLQMLLMAGIPAAVLVAGLVVYVVRRR